MLKRAGLAFALCLMAFSPFVSPTVAQLAQQPAATEHVPGESMAPGVPMDFSFEAMKYGIAQGGLALVCVVLILVLYREFVRKVDNRDEQLKREQARSDRLEEVLDRSSAAITNSAVATARQTDATHRLARTVEQLEKRIAG